MSAENDTTLRVYERKVQQYLDGTPDTVDVSLRSWLLSAVYGLGSDASIFEIGSGGGRDAVFLQSLGFTVQCSDAVEGFVEVLRSRGLNAVTFNAVTGSYPAETYDLVLADAVLLHFTLNDFSKVVRGVLQSLKRHGRFAFTLKTGEGSEWSDAKVGADRFFQYWDAESVHEHLISAGFMEVGVNESSPGWLHVVAYR